MKKILCFSLAFIMAFSAVIPAFAIDKCEHTVACTDKTKCIFCGATMKDDDDTYIDHDYRIVSDKTTHGSKCALCGDLQFTAPHYTDCIDDSKTTCSYCDAENVTIKADMLKLHQSFDYTYEKNGTEYHAENTCMLCNKVITKEHVFRQKLEYRDGAMHKVLCEACGALILTNFHSYNCTETPDTCVECKGKITDTENVYAQHNYGEWVVTKAPTKTTPGVQEITCLDCGDKAEEIIAHISIKNKIEEIEINYGQVLHLEADYEGGYVGWTVNEKPQKGDTLDHSAADGDALIFVTLFDKNGNLVSEELGDMITVIVKTNFWLKIVAFFRYTLFRMDNTVYLK